MLKYKQHPGSLELFSTSLYLNNSMSCTLNLCKPSICFLIDRNYLTINISGAGKVSTNHLPSFISSPPTTCALNSFSKVSFSPPSFNIPFSLHQRMPEAWTSHNTPLSLLVKNSATTCSTSPYSRLWESQYSRNLRAKAQSFWWSPLNPLGITFGGSVNIW